MMKMPVLSLAALWLSLACHFCHAQEDTILAKYTHPGIRIGISRTDLVSICPHAIDSSQGSNQSLPHGEAKARLVEMINKDNRRTAVWYVLKDQVLRGVSVSVGYTEAQSDDRQRFERNIRDYFDATCDPIGTDRILRSNGIRGFIVSAIHWRERIRSIDCYLVSTNQEVSFVMVDRAFLDSDDFFLPPSAKEQIDKNGDQLLMKLPEEARAKALSEVQPIFDVEPTIPPRFRSSQNVFGADDVISQRSVSSIAREAAVSKSTAPKPSLAWLAIGALVIGVLWLLVKKRK